MKNGYKLINLLSSKIETNYHLIDNLTSISKEQFAQSKDLVTLAIGLVSEIRNIISSLDENIYFLNKSLYDILSPFNNYVNNMFNEYGFVNAYKLYDVLKIDLLEIRNFIKKIN